VVVKEDEEVVKYGGELKYAALADFLSQYALPPPKKAAKSSSSGGQKATPPPPPKVKIFLSLSLSLSPSLTHFIFTGRGTTCVV